MSTLWRNWGLWIVIGSIGACLLVSFPYFESTRNANERPRIIQILSILDEGELHIDGPAARRLRTGPDVSRNPVTGQLFPNKPPGATLFALPAYALATLQKAPEPTDLKTLTLWARILTGWLPTLLVLLMAWFFFGNTSSMALGIALILYGLGSPAASYAQLFYGHQLAACCLFGGIGLLCRAQRAGSTGTAMLGGLSAGIALLVEYGAGFAGLPIGIFLLSRISKPGGPIRLIAASACAALPILILLAYHEHAFGSPWSTGYHHVINPEFAEKHGQGFLGLGLPKWEAFYTHILSPAGGLFWWMPLFPLALIGLVRESRNGTYRQEAMLFLSFILLMVLVGSSLSFDGGWRVGPRYMVVALPGLILGWQRYFGDLQSGWRWSLVITLAIWSIAMNSAAAHLWPHLDLTHIRAPWSDVLRPLLVDGCRPDMLFGLPPEGLWILLSIPFALLIALLQMLPACTWKQTSTGILLGAALLVLQPPSTAPKREANLRYIEAMHNCGEETSARKSFKIHPISAGSKGGT